MKRFLSLALVLVMLASMLVITVNAAEPFGTVVEIPYTETAPNMEPESLDASWGEKLIHVDRHSPNAGIIQWTDNGALNPNVNQEIGLDLYGMWTDTDLYLCFACPDTDMVGDALYYMGDCVQFVAYPGIIDISYCNGVSTGWTELYEYFDYDWTLSLDFDDVSTDGGYNAIDEGAVFADLKNNQMLFKFKMPFTVIGFGKNDKIDDGTYISFALVRNDFDSRGVASSLEWGDFYDAKKGWASDNSALYLARAETKETTTANTFKLVGKGGGTPATTETPVTPVTTGDKVTLKGTPSSWAKAEVEAALAADLIPEELTDGFTNGISRANLSKILSKLLDKVYGKDAEKSDAKFTDTTDADVLKAANLGIINGYEQADGTFMFKPDNTLKRSEMAAIINRVAKLCGQTVTGFDSEVTFTDTASHWCKGELGWPVHNGIVKGTSDTTFSPENTLTVEQTIMMIYRTYEALK